jgi:pimeloyl-ACP methyl ester carboxylesterase
MKYVRANGIQFAYLEEGSGPLVLLFHGFPDTAHTWDDVLPKIAAKGYRAVAPFQRGYAPTEIPERDATGETLGRDGLALIEALGETRAILIGHDWGATTVYGATALDQTRVSKLIAVGIPHPATIVPTLRKLWGVRHFLLYKLPGASKRFAANDFAALPKVCTRWSPTWQFSKSDLDDVRECFSNEASLEAAFGYYRELKFVAESYWRPKIAVETIVFCGTDDPNAELVDYERGRKKFTGSYTIEQMPGGHFMHREHPEIFAEKILAHL